LGVFDVLIIASLAALPSKLQHLIDRWCNEVSGGPVHLANAALKSPLVEGDRAAPSDVVHDLMILLSNRSAKSRRVPFDALKRRNEIGRLHRLRLFGGALERLDRGVGPVCRRMREGPKLLPVRFDKAVVRRSAIGGWGLEPIGMGVGIEPQRKFVPKRVEHVERTDGGT